MVRKQRQFKSKYANAEERKAAATARRKEREAQKRIERKAAASALKE